MLIINDEDRVEESLALEYIQTRICFNFLKNFICLLLFSEKMEGSWKRGKPYTHTAAAQILHCTGCCWSQEEVAKNYMFYDCECVSESALFECAVVSRLRRRRRLL